MAKPMIPSLPDFRRTRLHGPNRGQVKTFSYVLSAIALGRLPGEQTLSRQAVLTRLFAALALAIALWVFTTQQQNPVVSHTFSLPVVVLQGSLPKNLAIRGGLTPVRVTASGLQSSFNGTNSLSAFVDLRNVPPNAREATVPVQLSGKRGDVQYTVSPPSLQLSLEPQQAKKVQVLFSPQSSLPSTLVQVGATQISPLLVTVSGPASEVAQVASATAAAPLNTIAPPLNAGAGAFSVPLTLPVQLVDKNGNSISDPRLTVSPGEVTITLQVQEQYQSRLLSVLPLLVGSLPPGYLLGPQALQINPPTVFVLSVPGALSEQQTTVLTDPIDLSHITHSMTVTTHLDLPPNVLALAVGRNGPTTNSRGGPTAQVYITVSKQKSPEVLQARVTTENLGHGLQASVDPAWVDVYVTGAVADIARVGPLQAQLDLNGLGPGSYDLHPTVNMPRALPRYSISPATIHVVISSAKSHKTSPARAPSPG